MPWIERCLYLVNSFISFLHLDFSLGKSKEEQSKSTSTTTIPVESQSEKFSQPMDEEASSSLSLSPKVTQILGQNPTSGTHDKDANNQGGKGRGKSKMLVTSSLLVKMARSSDTGNYKCASEAGESMPTSIHVITGEFLQIWALHMCWPTQKGHWSRKLLSGHDRGPPISRFNQAC